jgi:hypothetical protein
MNREQRMIKDAARELLDVLTRVVPETTNHYAVERARAAVRILVAYADTVNTAPAAEPYRPSRMVRFLLPKLRQREDNLVVLTELVMDETSWSREDAQTRVIESATEEGN